MKKVGISFWSVFEKDWDTKAVKPKNLNKDSFRKMAEKTDVVFYVDRPSSITYGDEIGEHEAPFQEMIMKKLVEKQLQNNGVPFSSVELEKPSDIDINVDYKVTEHKNWEDAIIDAIREEDNE